MNKIYEAYKECLTEAMSTKAIKAFQDELEDFDWSYYVGANNSERRAGDAKMQHFQKIAKSDKQAMQMWKSFGGPKTLKDRKDYR